MKFIKLFMLLLLFNNVLFAKDIKKVTLQLQWKYQFQFAGFIMAKEKGFYKKKNLDVTIKEWETSIKTIDEVVNGKSDYALSRPTVLIDISKGKEIVLLSAIYQSSPLCLVTTKESGIKSIKDFKNKRMMSSGDMNTDVSLISMMFSQGVDIKKDMIVQQPSFDVTSLLNDKTDLITSYVSNEPYLLKELGAKAIIFSPKDYGFDFYNDILITSKKHLEQNPKEVKDFTQSSLDGWEYAFDHINETVDIIYKKYNTQNKSKKALLFEAKKLKELAYYKTKKLGKIEINNLEKIYTVYKLLGLANKDINFNNIIYKANGINKLTLKEKLWIRNNILRIGTEYWKPIVYLEDNKLKGAVGDMLSLIIKNLNLTVDIKSGEWKDTLNNFKQHKTDLLPAVYYTKERTKIGNYSSKIFSLPEYLYIKSTNKKIKNFDDLKGKKLAIIKGYAMINMVHKKYPSIKIIETKDLQQSINLVLDNKVEALIDGQIIVQNYIHDNLVSGLKGMSQTSFASNDVYFLSNINKPIIASILEKGLSSISIEDKNKIISKWIQIKDDKNNKFLSSSEKKYIKNHKIIKMCNNPNWTPIEFAKDGDTSNMQGIAIDTLKVLEKQLNIKFQNVPTKDWKESQQYLRDKKCDILPCAIETKKRKEYANFTKPYLKYKLAIITKNDKPFVNGIEDIVDKTIARKEGSGLISKLKSIYPNINIIETKDYSESLQKVSKGEAYCTIATLPVASYYISKFALNNLQVAGYTNMKYDLSIAVRDDDKILLSILDKTLDKIPQNIFKDIYIKWLGSPIKKSLFDYKLLWYILSGIVIVILLLLYKQLILRNSIKDFNELIDATMEGILLFKDEECVDINQSALNIFEYDVKDQMIGKKLLELISDESKDILKNNIASKDSQEYEVVMLKKDGSKFYALLRGHDLKNKKVRLISIIDITNLKKQEKLISEQAKLASMGEMIGNIAHQWRQPLSVISSASTGMKMQKEFGLLNDELIDSSCDVINKNAQYLSKTIDDFRNFIKGNRNKSIFKIKNQINSFINLVEGTIKTNNINLVVNLNEDVEINGYENELTQCVINIFNNAKDALVENVNQNRLIIISTLSENNNLIIKIQDNAGGIPSQILSKIFEPYFTTKHQSQGTGLGLNMTYKLIVDGMNGTIEAKNIIFTYENEKYTGALFSIKLPLNLEEK